MKKLFICVICLMFIFLLASCNTSGGTPAPDNPDPAQNEPANDTTQAPLQTDQPSTAAADTAPPDASSVQDGPTEADTDKNNPFGSEDSAGLNYRDLADMVFWFGSGVGAWHTEVTIQPDGSFNGYHQDSDMGDIGADYPNGTCYICYFSGQFSPLVKVNDYEYTMKCESLTQEGESGDEYIMEDGVKYIISTPYGFDYADEFVLYLPGRTTAGLSEEFLMWVCAPRAIDPEEITVLNFWGLYNKGGEEGFSCDGRQYDIGGSVDEWPADLPDDIQVYMDGVITAVYADSDGTLYIDIGNTTREAYEDYIDQLIAAGWEAGDDRDPWGCTLIKEGGGAYQTVGVDIDEDETSVTIIVVP